MLKTAIGFALWVGVLPSWAQALGKVEGIRCEDESVTKGPLFDEVGQPEVERVQTTAIRILKERTTGNYQLKLLKSRALRVDARQAALLKVADRKRLDLIAAADPAKEVIAADQLDCQFEGYIALCESQDPAAKIRKFSTEVRSVRLASTREGTATPARLAVAEFQQFHLHLMHSTADHELETVQAFRDLYQTGMPLSTCKLIESKVSLDPAQKP